MRKIMKEKLRKELTIHNVVCTAELKQPVNVASFNKYRYLTSNLDLYNCGYVKDDTMKGRVTVFPSGKMISVGTKSPKHAADELKKAIKIMKNYNLIHSLRILPKTRNIVARFNLNRRISLGKLARTLPRSMYEPEIFPGLIYRIQDSLVALIFASGKGVLVGAKSVNDLNVGMFEVKTRIQKNN